MRELSCPACGHLSAPTDKEHNIGKVARSGHNSWLTIILTPKLKKSYPLLLLLFLPSQMFSLFSLPSFHFSLLVFEVSLDQSLNVGHFHVSCCFPFLWNHPFQQL